MYRDILVATDDSPESAAAVSRAIELTAQLDATLTAIYVVNTRLGKTSATEEPYRQTATDVFSEIKREASPYDVSVKTELAEGKPPEQILEYATNHGIDLIVIGGKDKSLAERFFISDTTEKVVRHAPMSVLVVREESSGS